MKGKKWWLGIPMVALVFAMMLFAGCVVEERDRQYTVINHSSHTVTLMVRGGGSRVSIPAGTTTIITLVGNVTLNDLDFTPANFVRPTISGTTITFRNL